MVEEKHTALLHTLSVESKIVFATIIITKDAISSRNASSFILRAHAVFWHFLKLASRAQLITLQHRYTRADCRQREDTH
jgi:hypothetical protein